MYVFLLLLHYRLYGLFETYLTRQRGIVAASITGAEPVAKLSMLRRDDLSFSQTNLVSSIVPFVGHDGTNVSLDNLLGSAYNIIGVEGYCPVLFKTVSVALRSIMGIALRPPGGENPRPLVSDLLKRMDAGIGHPLAIKSIENWSLGSVTVAEFIDAVRDVLEVMNMSPSKIAQSGGEEGDNNVALFRSRIMSEYNKVTSTTLSLENVVAKSPTFSLPLAKMPDIFQVLTLRSALFIPDTNDFIAAALENAKQQSKDSPFWQLEQVLKGGVQICNSLEFPPIIGGGRESKFHPFKQIRYQNYPSKGWVEFIPEILQNGETVSVLATEIVPQYILRGAEVDKRDIGPYIPKSNHSVHFKSMGVRLYPLHLSVSSKHRVLATVPASYGISAYKSKCSFHTPEYPEMFLRIFENTAHYSWDSRIDHLTGGLLAQELVSATLHPETKCYTFRTFDNKPNLGANEERNLAELLAISNQYNGCDNDDLIEDATVFGYVVNSVVTRLFAEVLNRVYLTPYNDARIKPEATCSSVFLAVDDYVPKP
jgi:hypothetical protein